MRNNTKSKFRTLFNIKMPRKADKTKISEQKKVLSIYISGEKIAEIKESNFVEI